MLKYLKYIVIRRGNKNTWTVNVLLVVNFQKVGWLEFNVPAISEMILES